MAGGGGDGDVFIAVDGAIEPLSGTGEDDGMDSTTEREYRRIRAMVDGSMPLSVVARLSAAVLSISDRRRTRGLRRPDAILRGKWILAHEPKDDETRCFQR